MYATHKNTANIETDQNIHNDVLAWAVNFPIGPSGPLVLVAFIVIAVQEYKTEFTSSLFIMNSININGSLNAIITAN